MAVYTDITDEELVYILTHADARVVFVENLTMLEKLQRCRHRLKSFWPTTTLARRSA